MNSNINNIISKDKIEFYELLISQMKSVFSEIQTFALKKPDAVVSKFKFKIIRNLLIDSREILKEENSLKYLEFPDEDDLLQNSDIVVLLNQYIAALTDYRQKFSTRDRFGVWDWN